MSALMYNILIFDSLYVKELINYLTSIDGEVVLSNCGITGTENYFIDYDRFWGIFVNNWIWWIRRVLLETWDVLISSITERNKYSSFYVIFAENSQYKSVENIEIYVHFVASWLQLIYILWVFYVSIFSICHNFIISGG